ncbi:hypothetical protein Tco_1377580 [Tanacetum coccineum]
MKSHPIVTIPLLPDFGGVTASTYDDSGEDNDLLMDEENEIVEPDVDMHLFGITTDVSFNNISVTNLVPYDVLEGEDVDELNVDGFDSDMGYDDEMGHHRRKRCLQSKEIKHFTYKFLVEHIFDQVRVNPGRALSDLLYNNICEIFNGKIVGGWDKPVITHLEYIREYCMKRIVNVQSVIDKYDGPLTLTTTRIMESIKKDAHLLKVQWNERIKCCNLLIGSEWTASGKSAKASGSAFWQAEQAVVMSTWMAFEGNTRDLDSIWEETGQDYNSTPNSKKKMLTDFGDGVRIISDAVRISKKWRQEFGDCIRTPM